MKTTHQGKCIPDFIVRYSSTRKLASGKPALECVVPTEKEWKSRFFLRRCISENALGAISQERPNYEPPMREFVRRTVLIQKILWNAAEHRWEGNRFTPEEYEDLVQRTTAVGLIPQYRKPKDPTGGGRAAKAAGKFWISRRTDNVMICDEMYRSRLGVDPDKLNPAEKVKRVPILMANATRFTRPPVIRFTPNEMGGIALVSAAFAQEQGLERGDKLWPIKASVEILPENSPMRIDVDMIIPADANKFKEHAENPEVLRNLLGWIPELTARMRSSQEKDRIPKLALDTMQWLYPEIASEFTTERVQTRLGEVRAAIEGRLSVEEMMKFGQFTKPDGTLGYQSEFLFLQKGQPLVDKNVRDGVFRAVGTHATKTLSFRAAGRYGVAMPLRAQEGNTRKRLVFLPPWMLPFWVETDKGTDHAIGVDSDWTIGCLGKDYDGDLAIILIIDQLMAKLGLSPDIFPDWTSEEDRTWALESMRLPEKVKDNDPRDVHKIMSDGLSAYGLIGQATNMCMVVLDALRATGVPRDVLMATYLRMMSEEVQPFVDALKYVPGGLKLPDVSEVAKKYGANMGLVKLVTEYFRAVRNMDIDKLATLPENRKLQGSFYYALSTLFRGWKPVPRYNMQYVAAEVLKRLPASELLERRRAASFNRCKGVIEERMKLLTEGQYPVAPSLELQKVLVALCWKARDTGLALAVEAKAGVRILDIAKELGIDPVEKKSNEPEQEPVA